MEKNKLITIIATFALIIYIIIDLVINDSLWDASANLAIDLQKNNFPGETFMY